jgi:hypothetical protein
MKDSENRLAFEYVHSDGGRSIKIVEPIMIEFEQSSNLEGWFLEGIDVATNLRQKFLMKSIQRVIDVFPQRFLCVTVYVFNSQNKLLMVLNKNLGKWVPPGGKVDNHETPDEAAIRECFEETGVNIELVGEKPSFDGALVTPIGSQ